MTMGLGASHTNERKFMSFLISLIPTLIVLGLLILIHELGHFIACRLTGVRVEKFSIGFGPEIFRIQGPETAYVISLLPLGGFVKPAGEMVSEVEGDEPKAGEYLAAPWLSKIFIVTAGVIMNYFLAFVLFSWVFMIGRPIPGTVIGGFIDGYPAKASALSAGDRIISINGLGVETWQQMTEEINRLDGSELLLTVEKNGTAGALYDVHLTPKVENAKDLFGKPVTAKRLGVTPSPESQVFEKFSFREALVKGADSVIHLTVLTHKAIFYMLTGQMSARSMSGPIGIVAMTGSAAQLGLPYVIQLAASLSVSLAVINLLPIPALDGGHFFFLLWEGITRRRISYKVQEKLTQAGFALLMLLMVFVIYNDLLNLSVIEKVKQFFIK